MATLVPQIKSRLFIPTLHKSLHLLEGAYASVLLGRSHEFEDLREYHPGDQIRDIDWRATARLGTPYVKRSRAMRMHTVLFVADTGVGMTALAPDENPKLDLAVLAIGVLGLLTVRHGDDFTVAYGDDTGIGRLPPRRSEAALEHALRTVSDRAAQPGHSDRDALLDTVAHTLTRRRIVVLVTDEAPLTDRGAHLARRLRVQHDVLWLTIRDADPVAADAAVTAARDVDTGWAVPDFLRGHGEIAAELAAQRAAEDARRTRVMDELGIAHVELTAADQVVPDLLRLLARRSHARVR